MTTPLRFASLLAAAALTLAAAAQPLLANGRVLRFDRQDAGPYQVSLGTIPDTPIIGNLHLTMTIKDTASDAYVLDALVTVTGQGPSGGAALIGPVQASTNLRDPTFYDVNTAVDELGPWIFTVRIEAGPGEAQAAFSVEVREANPLGAIAVLAGLLALMTILGLSVRAYLQQKRNRAANRV